MFRLEEIVILRADGPEILSELTRKNELYNVVKKRQKKHLQHIEKMCIILHSV